MTDRLVILVVVVSLAVFATLGMAGLIYLVAVHVSGNDLAIIATPTGTALGALGALLVSTRSTPTEPTPVTGAPGGEPVAVVETPSPRTAGKRAA